MNTTLTPEPHLQELAAHAAATELQQKEEDKEDAEALKNETLNDSTTDLNNDQLVESMKKLGWESEFDIKLALNQARGDVSAACEILERNEEENEEIRKESRVIADEGRWSLEAAGTSMCVYIYIYACMCVYVCVYIYTCVYMCVLDATS